jgi:polysaccharide biosynthesis protein PelE
MAESERSSNAAGASGAWRVALSVIAVVAIAVLAFVQGNALWQLAPGWVVEGPILPAILLDTACGALQAVLFRQLLPRRYREPRALTLLFLWLFCTFVPVAGGLVLLASCIWAAWFPGKHNDDDLEEVPAPQFVTYLMSRVSHGGGARLQARLVNTQVNASDRLSALVAIQSMPTRTTGTLLRDLLADPIEDVRLIAYGTLDQAENDVMQKIFQTAQTLEFAPTDGERHAINRQLAELYFELVYQNLVQGAVYTHTLEQADRYASAALEIDDSDAALWLIRGRLALAQGAAEDAAHYLARAQTLGFPRERLVPWLAEAAFLQRDYARVAELLASLGRASSLPLLKPVVQYWSP